MFVVFLIIGLSLVYLALPGKRKKGARTSKPLLHACARVTLGEQTVSLLGNMRVRTTKNHVEIEILRKAPVWWGDADVVQFTSVWLAAQQKQKTLPHTITVKYSDAARAFEITHVAIDKTQAVLAQLAAAQHDPSLAHRHHEATKLCNACVFSTLCEASLVRENAILF